MSAGEAGGPCANHGYVVAGSGLLGAFLLPIGVNALQFEVVGLDTKAFADKAFERANANGRIDSAAAAFGLAWSGANAAAN